MKSGYGKALRNFILKFNPKFILDFAGHKVFEIPTVDVNLLMLNKENNKNEVQAAVMHLPIKMTTYLIILKTIK